MTQVTALNDIEVIAPNLKRRLSGVTATIARLVPVQADDIAIVATGPGLPEETPHIPLWRALTLPNNRWRVWHARRNSEMLLGLIARSILRRKLKLVFTSSSPRTRGGWTNFLVAKMDAIVATNSKNATVMTHPNVILVPHGVDTKVFHPAPGKQAGEGGPVVGCVGRVRPAKGTAEFVRAMVRLLPKHPQWSAVVSGRVDDRTYFEGMQAEIVASGLEDRITFVDASPVEDMPSIYRGLSLLAAPSHLEGFGLTPFEAAACGVPAVASRNVGSFNDLIVEGINGALVDAGDTDALAHALDRFLSDRSYLEASAAHARQIAVEKFSIETEAQALTGLYRKLLGAA